jgi:tetratricopeptide (TPR) repeat protein
MYVNTADLEPIRELYEQGRYLQAYECARALGPLEAWQGTPARLIAGRLAANLGAPDLAHRLHVGAWRHDRDNPEARYYYARVLLERRGPLPTWQFLSRDPELVGAEPGTRADWLSFRATVAAHLRDFDVAEELLAQAEALGPERPWLWIERASVLELEDRYEEALAAARRSLKLHPWYRPGVQDVANGLQLLDRDTEALTLLTQAAERLESSGVVAQLTLLQTELELFEEAWHSLERFARLSPLMEPEVVQWLAGRRADVAYGRGDLAEAEAQARRVGDGFHERLAARLANKGDDCRRVFLRVGFVRQHHMTCGPATLSAISRFWSMPADHLSVAEAICYDGTPDHSERHWAETNGWVAREFAVTWESATALLDRGVPFTLSTVETGSAHLQAVIGYDSLRRTLLIRDPYQRHHGEFLADEMLARYRATGPRGMALVPREQAALLEMELPEAALYDLLHRVQRALVRHDRTAAETAEATLQAAAPGHRLTLQARRAFADYDADQSGMLACIQEILTLFPDDGNLRLVQLACLRDLARREERLTLLKEICDREHSHPIFWQEYARELAADAREHPAALRLLRRSARVSPRSDSTLSILGGIRWDQRRFPEACELYRFAACLDDTHEGYAHAYFMASRHLRQTRTAMRFLQGRFRRLGSRSSQPARTLFWAHHQLDQMTEAFAVLDAALAQRANDGDLLLFAAEAHGRHGDGERAAALLTVAQGKCGRTAWLRTAAELALLRGDLAAALRLQRQVAEAEPLSVEAHRAVVQRLAETESKAAALAYLEQITERFPHHYGLHQLRIEWLREEGESTAIEAALRRLIEINPVDAWARRELALVLGDERRLDEAFAEMEIARGLDPDTPPYFCVQGQLCGMAARMEEARAAYRQAISLSVDTDFAIAALVDACDSPAQRREALRFVEQELVRQVVFGDGLLAFRDQAHGVLSADELLTTLREALAARPDLWHAWSAVIRQLTDMDQTQEAFDQAQQATERFPLMPRLWLDLALVCQARRDRTAEIDALQRALRISPGWGVAARQLAAAHARAGDTARTRAILEQAVAHTPLDPGNHAGLADTLWDLGEKEAALTHLERAVELEPGYDWAWNALAEWSGGQRRAETAARTLTTRRRGEARSWLILARMLTGAEALPERLAALDQALALNPRCLDAYTFKAELLTEVHRFDEALAACRPALWATPPTELRARAAWVEAERGQIRAAITQMQGVVAEDPHDYEAWNLLHRWHDQAGERQEALTAARTLVRLAPQNPYSWGMLGRASLGIEDRAGAKRAFRRALDLAPDYDYAGLSLFDEQFTDEEFTEAAATLDLLRPHIDAAWVLPRDVRLAARREDRATAAQRLRELCVTATEDPWPLHAAVHAMATTGWAGEVEQIFAEALDRPDVNPRVGEMWVRSCAVRHDWSCANQLEALRKRGEIGLHATSAYVETLADAQRSLPLRRFIGRHRELLRAHNLTWGSTGYALLTLGDHRATVAWFTDWAQRPGVQPWMLHNLVVALRALGRDTEAAVVSRHALALGVEDWGTPSHHIWLALDAAVTGKTVSAADHLVALDTNALDAEDRFLFACVRALIEIQQRPDPDRAVAFAVARQRLREAAGFCPNYVMQPALARAYRRCVRRIAHDCSGPLATLWAWGRVVLTR